MINSDFNIDSDPIFKEFLYNRNLRASTRDNYKYHLTNYCQLIEKTPKELIEEAEKEEDKGIRLRRRKIGLNLARFRDHYEERGFSPSHIKIGLTMVRSFYNEFEIQLPKTRYRRTTVKDDLKGTIVDLPTFEEIQKALGVASQTYKAIILLMVSSGMGRAEIISLTVQDFINSISDYFDKPITLPLEIDRIRKKLDRINGPVATWNIRRVKTNGKYTTFSTPESIFAILNYLEKQPPESMNRKLFIPHRYSAKGAKMDKMFKMAVSSVSSLDPSAFSKTFQRINDKCGFGKQNGQSKFRSQSLRKFFANQLMKTGLGQFNTDWMLGHKVKNPVTEVYFKPDPQHLRIEYRQVMEAVTITNKVEVIKVTDEKVEELEKELNSLRQANEYMTELYNKTRKEILDFKDYIEKGPPMLTVSSLTALDEDGKPEKLLPRKIPGKYKKKFKD